MLITDMMTPTSQFQKHSPNFGSSAVLMYRLPQSGNSFIIGAGVVNSWG